jgi:hypothetical protein
MALSVAELTTIGHAEGAQYIADLIGDRGMWCTSIRLYASLLALLS